MRTPDVARAVREKLNGRTVIASVSGGKDSTALSLYMSELGIEHRRVFMDTGWEHEITYEYIRGPLTAKLGPITEIRGPLQMEDLVRKKGMFPSRQRRFCTEELKIFPMRDYIAALLDAGTDVVNAVGIRGEESADRAKMPEWEWEKTYDCDVWRPLIDWKLDDVIAIHDRHGLRPNPLYLPPYNATRVGCWPCINSRKHEIRTVADETPQYIVRLRVLEREVGDAARQRYERDAAEWARNPDPEPTADSYETADAFGAAQGRWEQKRKRLTSPFTPPAWFQARLSEETGGGFPAWPIDKVVAWSHTSRGGRQVELFSSPGQLGCVRWGLCDLGTEDGGTQC